MSHISVALPAREPTSGKCLERSKVNLRPDIRSDDIVARSRRCCAWVKRWRTCRMANSSTSCSIVEVCVRWCFEELLALRTGDGRVSSLYAAGSMYHEIWTTHLPYLQSAIGSSIQTSRLSKAHCSRRSAMCSSDKLFVLTSSNSQVASLSPHHLP